MGLTAFWAGLGRGARWGLGIGAAAILVVAALLGYAVLHAEYDVLFARLSAQDAAAMTHELDQMKVPYRLSDDGTTILVDRAAVHETRLKLMGKDLPLHGAVGFELFNNTDFGMTEFAQKVNYQRALQGELTRTVLSLAEVESARVHLAFPEEGLFKREQGRTKASITLTLREGKALRREQVRGIQRLVAAAVTGIESRDVTIVNDQGVALTEEGDDPVGGIASSARVEFKREIEQYLAQKANAVLDKAFGPGQALASVDVTLDMSQVKVTTEDVVTPKPGPGEAPTGVVLRERETTREGNRGAAGKDLDTATTTQHEVDYQLGRRVEQMVSSPGTITRLQVLAVMRMPLGSEQVEQLRQVLGTAVGAVRERGDSIVVQPLQGLAASVSGVPAAPAVPQGVRADTSPPATHAAPAPAAAVVPLLLALLLAVLAIGAVVVYRARRASPRPSLRMDQEQLEASLVQVRAWLAEPASPAHEEAAR